MQKVKKDSISVTTCVGRELFDMLDDFCARTGQSKTVAVERAIRRYCGRPGDDAASRDPDRGDGKEASP